MISANQFYAKATAVAGALVLASFIQPVMAAGVNQADSTKIQSYVESNGLSCMGCHAIGHKVLGPSFAAVSKMYSGKKGAEVLLTKRIANGGSGTWGLIQMPPGLATTVQSEKLATMILSLSAKSIKSTKSTGNNQ